MRIFLTGATGFIGTAVVPELIQAGHQVLGLARSEAGANALRAAGAEVQQGTMEDLEILRAAAAKSDGVIHTAFNHDFSKFAANCEADKRAIEALGAALKGTDRPLIVTGGVALLAPGRLATEADPPVPFSPHFPRQSEAAAVALVEQGVNASTMRLPQVHDTRKAGLVTFLIAIARQKGVSAYVGDGSNHWAAAHLLDVAQLYRLAIEKGSAGDRYHAVDEEGVVLRDIAEAVGRGLNVPVVSKTPEEAAEHFGFLAFFVGADCPVSSAQTQQRFGWRPANNPGLIEDLNNTNYSEA
ncbi:MAG: SDR family oxidoreductase [Ignavibacteriota bacterium]